MKNYYIFDINLINALKISVAEQGYSSDRIKFIYFKFDKKSLLEARKTAFKIIIFINKHLIILLPRHCNAVQKLSSIRLSTSGPVSKWMGVPKFFSSHTFGILVTGRSLNDAFPMVNGAISTISRIHSRKL